MSLESSLPGGALHAASNKGATDDSRRRRRIGRSELMMSGF